MEETMSRATTKQRWDFIDRLANHIGNKDSLSYFHDIAPIAKLIMRDGATYERIQTLRCNESMSDRRNAALDKQEAAIEARVTKRCAILGATPVFGGDPRGATIKIAVPDGHADDWGREGICVPTA
jgi:hypothetical protein